MEAVPFDRLARRLAAATSRRGLLRGLLALGASGLLGARRGGTAAQEVCQPPQPCVTNAGSCDAEVAFDGSCVCILAESALTCRRYTCSGDGDCPGGQVCTQAECGDGLGRCKTPCALSGAASTAAASTPCPAGETDCNGHCVDLSSDLVNCGACGTQCSLGSPHETDNSAR